MTAPRASLFILDTGPLITLAVADSLDYLLYPNVPVIIPDAVFYEAARDSAKLGAQSIMDWVKAQQAAYPARQPRGHIARQRPPNNLEAPGLPSKGRAPRHRAAAAAA